MAFWEWVDKRQIVRRGVLLFTLVMTYLAFKLGYDFALVSRFDGVGTAAVIAAFTAPVAYLQKSALDSYLANKWKPE
jgi:hypothetical protein